MRSPVMKIAAIHDLSGYGRTSLTVVIPVFSALGIQVCPLPTAVLSTQTSGMDEFCFVDLSEHLHSFLEHWKRMGLKFEAVYSGFLGSPGQSANVADCIDSCLMEGGLAVVDPVLGDNGVLDPTQTPEMVESLKWLVSKADLITPNLTEAALLLDEPMPGAAFDQRNSFMEEKQVREWLRRLTDMGPGMAVITSVPLRGGKKGGSAVLAYDREQRRYWKVDCEYIPAFYPGTGDTFTSVLTGGLLQGDSLPLAMDRAVQFVTLGIRATFGYNLPSTGGIMLERVLNTLHAPFGGCGYELLEEDNEE